MRWMRTTSISRRRGTDRARSYRRRRAVSSERSGDDDPTGDTCARAAFGLGPIVVRLGEDDQRGAAGLEQRSRSARADLHQRRRGVVAAQPGGPDHQAGQVAGHRPVGVEQPVLFAERIEDPACAGKVRRIAPAVLVDLQTVHASQRAVWKAEIDEHLVGRLAEGDVGDQPPARVAHLGRCPTLARLRLALRHARQQAQPQGKAAAPS